MTSVEEILPRPMPDKDHPDAGDGDDRSSLTSYDDAQAGVKNIEAIGQTWTKWSLIPLTLG